MGILSTAAMTMVSKQILLPVLVVFGVLFTLFRLETESQSGGRTPYYVSDIPPHHKNAFCVFLAPPSKTPVPGDIAQEDHYLYGTRMLIYQLLHDPQTRTKSEIPFIVMVTPEISETSRDILRKDGAVIIEANPIKFDWIVPGRDRWLHVMDKLHVFELVQFEKILLLDSDIVVFKSLDGLFDDPATNALPNLGLKEQIREDELKQPRVYGMAGNSGPAEHDHPYPGPRGDRLNAGFVVLRPSIEMYNHYLSVCAIEGRFPGGSPEQDLWNYVHRPAGNMPWKQIDPTWTVNTPNANDVKSGVASVHEKYWRCRDGELRPHLLRSRWKMEAVFDYIEANR